MRRNEALLIDRRAKEPNRVVAPEQIAGVARGTVRERYDEAWRLLLPGIHVPREQAKPRKKPRKYRIHDLDGQIRDHECTRGEQSNALHGDIGAEIDGRGREGGIAGTGLSNQAMIRRLLSMQGFSRSDNNLGTTIRFLGSLTGYLGRPLGTDECRRRILAHFRDREASTLRLFREGVYAEESSPYLRLLRHAGVTYDDVVELVRTWGVEGALGRLHDAGVHVTLDEFKGRRPIRRGSLEIPVNATDFDNRTPAPHFVTTTGGSRGAGRELLIDIDLLAHEACYESHTLGQFGLTGRPRAIWRPVPPGTAGIKGMMRYAKAGYPMARWFSQSQCWTREAWRHSLFTAATMMTSRLTRRGLAWPEHVSINDASKVAGWLASCKSLGTPGLLETNVASAVRVCRAADTERIDISGSFFRVGGEPYTRGRAAVIEAAGCRAASHYSMSEAGRVANPCAHPSSLDDVHVATDKVAVLAREVRPAGADEAVSGLFMTTFHPSTPKIMINVEMGDYATLSTRPCGCIWQQIGFTLRLQDIHSYEKLTAEGMHFVGADLLTLIETTLPAKYGGGATDYQIVERDEDGVSVVTLVISPCIGAIDEVQLKATVLEQLGAGSASARMMAARWREAGTLRMLRREPYATAAGKVLALHAPHAGARHE